MGAALFAEYEDVLARPSLFRRSRLSASERSELLDIFAGRCEWTCIYFGWIPNLRDEADNHRLMEEMATIMIAEADAETRFAARAARGRGKVARGLALLRKAASSK
jgi:hypothetical protein